ncbi:unnamed protein product [Kuraishia capsulata CBS 1993]|uniref:YMC020W-like alpha/beta hydrolase domain-containing protein n=1 Tax=Kuraishia capsulata CBS 1993 TaxID=1382522 RepID=W6MXJ8_9ASCO|nr:uncharacterized protein KUCA_T00005001001 [Kuraishia capsulata CBS 1993]CDK29015.1 unnamed protein product [Kuraishia capsulata CBS 1993]
MPKVPIRSRLNKKIRPYLARMYLKKNNDDASTPTSHTATTAQPVTASSASVRSRSSAGDIPMGFEITQTDKTTRSSSWAFWQTAPGSISTANSQSGDHTDLPLDTTTQKDDSDTAASSGPAKNATSKGLEAETSLKTGETAQRSWLPWPRSASSASLKDLLIDPSSPSGNEPAQEPNGNRSWSIWSLGGGANGSANEVQDKPKEIIGPSNTIITEDAVLFEPATRKAQSVQSEEVSDQKPNLNKVVPKIEQCLPTESFASSVYNAYQKYYRRMGGAAYEPLHLSRIRPTTVKRVLIVGIHGFFPNKLLRPLLGEPTGTSIRFAREAEKAVLKWAKEQNMEVAIQKIALEKEGKVMDRVDFFFELMAKWQNEIKQADFIFVTAHSQGCPVSILLMSKLIEYGFITENQRAGILAMAGVNNGPYFGIDQKFFVRAYSTIENESMLELFEFQHFDSLLSRKYVESLRIIINNNVKVLFVGSIDDQLVPLYSAIASHVIHPNIYRAVYIDGTSNTPAFVSRIVSMSCSLMNLGFSDHGVIKEISKFLAGPLTGGGHSRIYNDIQVYDLGLEFFLSTNDLNAQNSNPQPVHFKGFDIKQLGANPFHLPWCMRGLIFEATKRLPSGKEQVDLMFDEFDSWNPESKVLKDMKYRLNGIRISL